jgi:dienelactone hydrolase
VRAAIFLYPYCGLANLGKEWEVNVASLFLLGAADRVISVEECLAVAESHRKKGHRVETRIYEGADHAFDERGLAGQLRPAYDPHATADARVRAREFLAAIFR